MVNAVVVAVLLWWLCYCGECCVGCFFGVSVVVSADVGVIVILMWR